MSEWIALSDGEYLNLAHAVSIKDHGQREVSVTFLQASEDSPGDFVTKYFQGDDAVSILRYMRHRYRTTTS